MASRQRGWQKAHPEKQRAKQMVTAAIKSGKLVAQPCGNCGSTDRVQAHHDDYTKPLDVRWLCISCHYATHGRRFIAHRTSIAIYYTPEQLTRIDKALEETRSKGVQLSRSEFVRRAVDQALAGQKEE